MPKVHTLTAAKDYPDHGIAKGDTYYKWSLRPGGRGKGTTYRSKTPPKPSQLTSSPFLKEMHDIQDRIDGLTLVVEKIYNDIEIESAIADVQSEIEAICDDIDALSEQPQESLDNMPESLQAGPTGELLQGRVDECESWQSELESAKDNAPDRDDDQSDEDYLDAVQSWLDDEVKCCTYNGE